MPVGDTAVPSDYCCVRPRLGSVNREGGTRILARCRGQEMLPLETFTQSLGLLAKLHPGLCLLMGLIQTLTLNGRRGAYVSSQQ